MPQRVRAAAGEAAGEAPALASVLGVAALAEYQEAVAREPVELVLVAGRARRVNQAAFGKVVVVVLVPEEVWEPAAPRVEEQGVVLAADQVRAREDPEAPAADPVAAAAALVRAEESALAAVGPGLAAVVAGRELAPALARVAEPVVVAGKHLESG